MMSIEAILAARPEPFAQAQQLPTPKVFGPRFQAYAQSQGIPAHQAWVYGPVPFHAWMRQQRLAGQVRHAA